MQRPYQRSNFPVPPRFQNGHQMNHSPGRIRPNQTRFDNSNLQGLLALDVKPPSLLSSNLVHQNMNYVNSRNFNQHVGTPPNRNRGGRGGYRGRGQFNRGGSNNSFDRRKSGGRMSIDSSINETLSSKLEKIALETNLPKAFYERIKPLKSLQLAKEGALEFTRKELDMKRGGNTSLANWKYAKKSYTCIQCRDNFENQAEADRHFNCPEHKEVDELCKVRKEQARLIFEKKLTHLNISEADIANCKKPISNSDIHPPDEYKLKILEAEKELSLATTELDLDPYILGIYESLMKPYWPNPRTQFHCRICNYKEFKTEQDLGKHNASPEHKKRELLYDDAFCLYCQIHTGDVASMQAHIESNTHGKIKNHMERSKQCAIERWHQANKLELPGKYLAEQNPATSKTNTIDPESAAVNNQQDLEKAGNKRSAPDPPDANMKSPSKKQNTASTVSNLSSISSISTSATTTTTKMKAATMVKTKAAQRIESLFLNKTNLSSSSNSDKSDSENTSVTPVVPVLNKIPKLPPSPVVNSYENLLPKEKVWFIPVNAFMCAACQTFVEESKMKAHCKEIIHNTNVIKFKRQVNM